MILSGRRFVQLCRDLRFLAAVRFLLKMGRWVQEFLAIFTIINFAVFTEVHKK
jgi:hypothetical protein